MVGVRGGEQTIIHTKLVSSAVVAAAAAWALFGRAGEVEAKWCGGSLQL